MPLKQGITSHNMFNKIFSKTVNKLILGGLLSILSTTSIAAEYRCGWLDNPTPANWWLDDREGSWTIAMQGGYSVSEKSMDNLPELKDDEYVKTNGLYGYACACMSVSIDKKNKRITKIHSKGTQLLLKKCLEDRHLVNKKEGKNNIPPASTKTRQNIRAHAEAKPHSIQLFTTSDRSKANRMKKDLTKVKFSTTVTTLERNGQTLYRVRVGPYAGKEAAMHFQQALKKLFKKNQSIQNSIIVRHIPVDNTQPIAQCYRKKVGKDITAIQLQQKQNKVSGYYAWTPKGKDGAYGSLTGVRVGDTIKGLSIVAIEGYIQKEDVIFKVSKNGLIQGHGELIEQKGGRLVFKNPSKLDWSDRFTKVNCRSVQSAIDKAK